MQHRRLGIPVERAADAETDLSSVAAFALAEHLTDVAVSPMLLQDTTFTCATVKIR